VEHWSTFVILVQNSPKATNDSIFNPVVEKLERVRIILKRKPSIISRGWSRIPVEASRACMHVWFLPHWCRQLAATACSCRHIPTRSCSRKLEQWRTQEFYTG